MVEVWGGLTCTCSPQLSWAGLRYGRWTGPLRALRLRWASLRRGSRWQITRAEPDALPRHAACERYQAPLRSGYRGRQRAARRVTRSALDGVEPWRGELSCAWLPA